MNPALSILAPLLMPVIFPYIGDVVSHALKQDHFARWFNDGIAWVVLLGCAIGDGILEGKINPPQSGASFNWFLAILQVVDALAVVLVAGPLVKLAPWVEGMQWVQAHIFTLPLSTIGQPATPSTVTVYNTGASASGPSMGGGNPTAAQWQRRPSNYLDPSQPFKGPLAHPNLDPSQPFKGPLAHPMPPMKEPPKTQLPPSLPTEDLGG